MSSPSGNARALEIIDALVQGNDPNDNSPLPPECVLNRSEVLRALLTAAVALESVVGRQARRAQLPGNGWRRLRRARRSRRPWR